MRTPRLQKDRHAADLVRQVASRPPLALMAAGGVVAHDESLRAAASHHMPAAAGQHAQLVPQAGRDSARLVVCAQVAPAPVRAAHQ